MAAPALVTLLFDALVEAGVDKNAGMTARKMAKFLEHKVLTINPDELHVMDIQPDGTWTLAHPAQCRPNLFGCAFQSLAVQGFSAPHPGRFNVVIEDEHLCLVVVK